MAAAGHVFVRWDGDVPAGQEGSTLITLPITQPRTVTAVFEAATTTLTMHIITTDDAPDAGRAR